MKSCPICGARAFDDAAVCYGCLHRFADEEAPVEDGMPAAIEASCPVERNACDSPAFLIRLRAMLSEDGECQWVCEVETEGMTASAAA